MEEEAGGVLEVRCISFGFRWGAPPPRVVQRFNLRGLENPPSSMLKRLTGLDKDLQKEVFAFKKTQNLYEEHVHTICQHIEHFMMLHNQEADEDEKTKAKEEDTQVSESEDEEEEEERDEGEEDCEESEEDEEEGDDDGEDEDEEDDRQLIMAFGFGCQRGRHRSVAFVERLSKEPRFREAFCAIAARLKHEARQQEHGHHPIRDWERYRLKVTAVHRDISKEASKQFPNGHNNNKNGGRRNGKQNRKEERRHKHRSSLFSGDE